MSDTASGVLFAAKRRCSVDGSEFGQKKEKGGGRLEQEACCSEIEVQQREWSKWEAITREMDRQTVLPNSSTFTVD